MTRPAYFPARLYDFDIARAEDGSERRPALGVVSAVMDPRDFGTFLTWVGALPAPADFWAAPDLAPGLIVLPCRVTQHPDANPELSLSIKEPMSRHTLLAFDHCKIVLGFDHPLSSFFGQVFDPRLDPEIVVDGWPTSSGLGIRRPIATEAQAKVDLAALALWIMGRRELPHSLWLGIASDRLKGIQRLLLDEWRTGVDRFSLSPPASLQGPFHPIPAVRP